MTNFEGILLYELFHDKAPFPGRSVEDVKKKIKRNQINFKKDVQPEIKKWIIKMLNVYPKHRPNVADILADPFFNRHKKMIEETQQRQSTTLTSNSSQRNSETNLKRISSSSPKVIQLNSLQSIKEQNSVNNSVNNSLNTSIKKTQTQLFQLNSSTNSNDQKILRVNSHNQPKSTFEKVNKFTFSNSSYQSQKPNIYQNNNFNNSYSHPQVRTLEPQSVTSSNSNYEKIPNTNFFKKKTNTEKIQVNEQPRYIINNKVAKALTSKLQVRKTPSSNKNFKLKKKVIGSHSKNNFQTGIKKIDNPLKNRKFVSSFKYGHSPVTGNYNSVQSSNSKPKLLSVNAKQNNVKWQPKKFLSSYHNSKLRSKLQNKIKTLNSGQSSGNMSHHVRLFSKKSGQNQPTHYYSQSQTNKNNLIRVSNGQGSDSSFGNINTEAFKSVHNPKSFSSSFQISKNKFQFNKNSVGNSPIRPATSSFHEKRKIQSTTSSNQQTPQKFHFLKKAPTQSFIKFLGPKIIRKNFNNNQSFKSNRVISNIGKTNGNLKTVDVGKGIQYKTSAI